MRKARTSKWPSTGRPLNTHPAQKPKFESVSAAKKKADDGVAVYDEDRLQRRQIQLVTMSANISATTSSTPPTGFPKSAIPSLESTMP